MNHLIRQCPGAGYNADRSAGLVHRTGHDADLAFAGRDDTGAVRTDQADRLICFSHISGHNFYQ